MPYINVSTSAKVNDKDKLLEEISILISSLTKKSRRFVMAKIDDNCQIYFDDMKKAHMSAVDKTFGKGRIGLGSFDDMNDFDDIKIWGK